jgi:uncharacterized coiled-coil DUF342 family protein
MTTTKNFEIIPEIQDIKEIRKEIHQNIELYSEKELNRKISEISNILKKLKSKRNKLRNKNQYDMKNLMKNKYI